MRTIIVLLSSVCLIGCSFNKYSIISSNGIEVKHIKSLEDCKRIIEKLEIDGICVEE